MIASPADAEPGIRRAQFVNFSIPLPQEWFRAAPAAFFLCPEYSRTGLSQSIIRRLITLHVCFAGSNLDAQALETLCAFTCLKVNLIKTVTLLQ